MKKIVALTFVLAFTVFFAACGVTDEPKNNNYPMPESEAEATFAYSEITEIAFECFLEISAIPRTSGNEQAISDYLKAFGEARGFETIQDDLLNILIRRPGSSGRENEPPIILQAHMDMVGEKNQDSAHNFLTDPIIPITENDWVYAPGTTLGADNGAGLAIILAILDATHLSHPPIEALITTEEETTMAGAVGFDASLLYGRRLINLDSMEEGIFTVSSAAMVNADLIIPIETEFVPDGLITYRLTVSGLMGGHSGVDIHKGLANANILMARLLNEIEDVYVSSIDGGSARNAIPRECTAVISLRNSDSIYSVVSQMESAFKTEFPFDENLSVTLEEISPAENAMSGESSQTVLDAILQIPNGVLVMSSDIEGLVQTSNNIGAIVTEGNTVMIKCAARSSYIAKLEEILDSIRSIANVTGARVETGNTSPAWPYRANSPLRDKMAEVFNQMYGTPPEIQAIHAGLESAVFALKMPDCDIISIGPDIFGYHSPSERMSLSSFYRTVEFLVNILEQI
jgi:dipeptidase D